MLFPNGETTFSKGEREGGRHVEKRRGGRGKKLGSIIEKRYKTGQQKFSLKISI